MIKFYSLFCSISFVIFLFLSGCTNNKLQVVTRGIYGHPQPLWDKGHSLPDLGVNAIFVHSGSINKKMMQRAKDEGVKVYAEFPVLNGKGYVEEHPEAWAINEKGERVEPASWFMGVCPTEPGFRKYRFNLLRTLLEQYDIDGVWMDYVHWHAQFEEPEPILPETCFCEHCLAVFSDAKKITVEGATVPDKSTWIFANCEIEWREWRCEVIADWALQIRQIMNDVKPGILLGLYHCPWNDDEFDSARRRILGLDYDLLREHIDIFSPMVYHARMGRDPEWVEDNITWFCNRLKIEQGVYPKVWPIVQAYNNPYTINASEFETVLKGGMADKSNGVMMFTTNAVAEDEGKLEVMKKVYTELQPE
jgi:hypothetical protein